MSIRDSRQPDFCWQSIATLETILDSTGVYGGPERDPAPIAPARTNMLACYLAITHRAAFEGPTFESSMEWLGNYAGITPDAAWEATKRLAECGVARGEQLACGEDRKWRFTVL